MSEGAVDDEDLPRPFGGYTLLARLGQGGMGEVFLAAKGGVEGISRRCVVKTLRPGFTDDREYVTRFLDEARVVAQLHHRNICPTFEVGKVDTRYFLAMEYIAGRDLKTVGERAKKHGTPLSRALSLHIVAEVLDALDYAHTLQDAVSGDPMLLVHRDVSPHNVMVGFDGDVRLIDFGLAASTLKVEQTAPNVVMGKVAYMAPEHICGDAIDARADQFAVAVMAAELFLGHRFYEGKSTRELYTLAAPGGFRPSTWNSLPPPLRQVLDRALAANADARFGSCGEFRDALDGCRDVVAEASRADMPALRGLMREVFSADIAAERALLSKAAGKAGVPAEHVVTGSIPSTQARVEDTSKEAAELTRREERDVTRLTQSAPSAKAQPSSSSSSSPTASSAKKPLLAAAAVVALVVVAVGVVVARPTPPTPPTPLPPTTTTPVTLPPPPPVETPPLPTTTVETPKTTPPPVETPKTTPTKKPTTKTPTTTVTTPTVAAPSATAPPGTRLRYVFEQCPSLPCTSALKAHARDWAGLEAEAQARFQSDLKTCFSRCTKN